MGSCVFCERHSYCVVATGLAEALLPCALSSSVGSVVATIAIASLVRRFTNLPHRDIFRLESCSLGG